MKNKIAVIDMGTNTFHLLVAEMEGKRHHVIHRDRVAVKIGMGGINDGRITDEGAQRAVDAIRDFKSALDSYSVKNIFAFGTSALRNARNGSDIVQRIKKETGIEARIIDGNEEATLIYEGVRSAMELGNQKSLIVDIGGGSVEFIIGNDKEIYWKQSFEIGGQRLLERFQKHDPILEAEIDELNDFFSRSLEPLLTAVARHQPEVLVGSSGTFDTLSEIHCIKNNIPFREDPETPLTIASFHEIFDEFKLKNREERRQIPGMIEMRVDMITVACCLVDFLLKKFSFQKIRVSTYSLKEGVLATYPTAKTKP